jgi:tight adherence protein B
LTDALPAVVAVTLATLLAVSPASAAALRRRLAAPGSGRYEWAAGLGRALFERRRIHKQGSTEAQRTRVVQLCSALAAELRTGTPPLRAMERAAREVPGCVDEAGAEARLGGDVAAALRRGADTRGGSALRQVAACWDLSRHTGAALAPMCDAIAGNLRADQLVRAEVSAQLASARATARLMAVLPGLALLLGSAVGAHPFRVLFGTPYGIACLAIGASLAGLGVTWVERLARAVEDDS